MPSFAQYAHLRGYHAKFYHLDHSKYFFLLNNQRSNKKHRNAYFKSPTKLYLKEMKKLSHIKEAATKIINISVSCNINKTAKILLLFFFLVQESENKEDYGSNTEICQLVDIIIHNKYFFFSSSQFVSLSSTENEIFQEIKLLQIFSCYRIIFN